MAKQTRNTLKGYFETGDIPVGANYVDLIDSKLNLSENNTGDIQLTGNITASGNISASGNIIVSQSLTFGAEIADIGAAGEIQLRGLTTGNEYLKVTDNAAIIFIQGSSVVNIDNDSINLNASNQDIDVKITHDNGVNAFQTDAANNRVKLMDFVTIGSGSAPNADPNSLYVNGSQFNNGHITSSGNISASGNLILDGNITASGDISASGVISAFGSSSLVGLPTTEPSITGALWLSGSGGGSASGSKYLMVFTG